MSIADDLRRSMECGMKRHESSGFVAESLTDKLERRSQESLAGSLRRSDRLSQGIALTASQIEAWEFVKRINLSNLWSQPIGLGVDMLKSMDWVQRMMPPVAAVYFICVEDETGIMPVYIGMTKAGMDRRISSRHHGAIKSMREYGDKYLCLRYVPLSEGMNIEDLEAAAISWWEPPLNVHQPMPSRKEIQIYVEELRAILA